jgi:hypothetical protein
MHFENADWGRPVGGIIRREDSIKTQEVGCELNKLVWRIMGYCEHGVETSGRVKSGNSMN